MKQDRYDDAKNSLSLREISAIDVASSKYKRRRYTSDSSDRTARPGIEVAHSIRDDMGKVKIRLPKLYGAGRKASSSWYVAFYYFDPMVGRLRRFKKTEGFAQLSTEADRKAHGKALVAKYACMLRDGWNPLDDGRVFSTDLIFSRGKAAGKVEATYNIEFYMNAFLADKSHSMRDKSFATYRTKVRRFVGWLKDTGCLQLPIFSFDANLARKYTDMLQAQMLHPNTLHAHIITLRSAWAWVESRYEDLELKNPWKKVQLSRVKGTPKRPFNEKQREQIFRHLNSTGQQHLVLACSLVYYCYIRPGRELHGLQVKHFDLVSRKINIPANIAKNKKPDSVNMPGKLVDLLKAAGIEKLHQEWFLFGHSGPSAAAVGKDRWSKRFTREIRRLGFGPEYSMYSWKHTGNQVAHQNGMPLEKQRRQNRHHSLDEMQTYLAGLEISNPEEMDGYFKD